MYNILLDSKKLKEYFQNRGYNCISPHSVANNKDTVFTTAGIQSVLADYRNSELVDTRNIYIAQPVLRTQFMNGISEGFGIAFVNLTTSGINISEQDYKSQVYDWIELFHKLGMNINDFTSQKKEYIRNWGDLVVSGKKTFYYYKNLEIGDTTFFNSITKDGKNIGINTMTDVGFGLERIRWCLGNNSYFDLFSNSEKLKADVKAYLSALALLEVNNIKPSNKNVGYRARLFSKKMANILEGKEFSEDENKYLRECLFYWKNWQESEKDISMANINKEYDRNCNRYILDLLINEGHDNISGININIGRREFNNRLISSGVPKKRIEAFNNRNDNQLKEIEEMER